MPKITDPEIVEILKNPYFDQHTAMHLDRERLILPDGKKLRLILPPCQCDDCRKKREKGGDTAKPARMAGMNMPDPMSGDSGMDDMGDMIEAGEPGSGRQLLDMHHEMIRVFRFLLETHEPAIDYLPYWPVDPYHKVRKWNSSPAAGLGHALEIWDLDDPAKLPHEIVGLLKVTDPEYLNLVFEGVQRLVEPNEKRLGDAVDDLGRFIEIGVEPGERPDGSGFHDTMHEYLGAHERRSAQGAEMNKLGASRFNDYFWSIHLWIDGQYGRLLEKRGQKFDTSPLDPKTIDMCTAKKAGKPGSNGSGPM